MEKIFKFKCCKPLSTSRKCSADTRNLTEAAIEKLKSFGCKIKLDTSMHICNKCRLHVYHLPSTITPSDMEQPSTSGVQTMGPVIIKSESIADIDQDLEQPSTSGV